MKRQKKIETMVGNSGAEMYWRLCHCVVTVEYVLWLSYQQAQLCDGTVKVQGYCLKRLKRLTHVI